MCVSTHTLTGIRTNSLYDTIILNWTNNVWYVAHVAMSDTDVANTVVNINIPFSLHMFHIIYRYI